MKLFLTNKGLYSNINMNEGDNMEEGKEDLYGDEAPSILFHTLTSLFGYLLEDEPEKSVSFMGTKIRKPLNKLIRVVGPYFLTNQVIEDRNLLQDPNSTEKDLGISLPKEPVIWAPNHRFQGDPLASLIAAQRYAYVVVGNLPQFYNTLDGVLSWLNGVVLVNRKDKNSRMASVEKSKKVLDYGTDLILFPEGTVNKTPHTLSLKLFPGIYRIAKEKNVKIVPIVQYKRSFNKDEVRHIVVDDPIDVSNMNEEEALNYIRDVYAYWYYLMMDRYGQSTREEEIMGFESSLAAWENILGNKPIGRNDNSIEKKADYLSRSEQERLEAYKDISNLSLNTSNAYLEGIVEEAKENLENNFQRRF